MITNQRDLFDLIDSVLKPNNYIKKGDTWYLDTPECICFLSIGKSPFAGRYENLMGCFVKKILKEDTIFPKYYKKNLFYLIEQFIGDDNTRLIFDLENKNFSGNKRELAIRGILTDYVLPFLDEISTEKGILGALAKYDNLKYQIDVELDDYLKLIK